MDHDEEAADSLKDDSIVVAALVAELERIIGPLDASIDDRRFQWLLPLETPSELLKILHEVPTGLGLRALEHFLRERLGTLSGLKRVRNDSDVDV